MTYTNGATIKTLRLRFKISQVDLARRAFIHPSTLRRIENGTQQPTQGVRHSIARALGVSESLLAMDLNEGSNDTSDDTLVSA